MEEKRYRNVVECALEYQGKFLVILRPTGKDAAGLLSFPGGKIEEQDEHPVHDMLKQAVIREIFEEVGITIQDPIEYITARYIGCYGIPIIPIINAVFYCNLTTPPTIIPSPREVPAYYWMTEQEINNAPNSPIWLKEYTKLIVQHKKSRK